MPRERFHLGCAPSNETCADPECGDHVPQMRVELEAYRNQLYRMFPPPGTAKFTIVWNQRDKMQFGEVVADFDPDVQDEVHWALAAEYGCSRWDDEAIEELTTAGYPREL